MADPQQRFQQFAPLIGVGLDTGEHLVAAAYDEVDYEPNNHNIGKTTWNYGPDLVSQSKASRMTSFEEHYPEPTTANYRAMSNFMWVAMEDCIRIHNAIQGKFKWTEADYEQVVALRAQGLTFIEVARHLSPTLTGQNVHDALIYFSSPGRVQGSRSLPTN
ncbi:hypothetical protein GGH93_006009 [Coemansia aciculifera]|nr:hypothetical protein GGH93_006009 [Coemansia aciculifera]